MYDPKYINLYSMGGDPGEMGGCVSPLEFVWDRICFEFAINPSLFRPPSDALTLQEIAVPAFQY